MLSIAQRTAVRWQARALLALACCIAGCTGDARHGDTTRLDTSLAADPSTSNDSGSASIATDSAARDTVSRIPSGPTPLLITRWSTDADSAAIAQSWFVLRERQSITELIPTRISVVESLARPCNDTGRGVKPAAINGDWLVLLSNVEGLRAGAVETGKLDTTTSSLRGAGDSSVFTFRGERFVIRATPATVASPTEATEVGDSAYFLVHEGKGGRRQLEREIPKSEWWRVLWAGDLNRDGAPELLVESSDKESMRYLDLYVSGALMSAERWRMSAAEAHHGC
jgi:hypothetical protein